MLTSNSFKANWESACSATGYRRDSCSKCTLVRTDGAKRSIDGAGSGARYVVIRAPHNPARAAPSVTGTRERTTRHRCWLGQLFPCLLDGLE